MTPSRDKEDQLVVWLNLTNSYDDEGGCMCESKRSCINANNESVLSFFFSLKL